MSITKPYEYCPNEEERSWEKTFFNELSTAVTPNIEPFSSMQGIDRVDDGATSNRTI